ncbi:MAG: IS701 family transposase [Longispora sp.]|nr:IS701 family transposase [Longispora sp. (in: high G+C Gram-positive bacteria)]
MAGCFHRWEPRLQAVKYVRALMSDLPRKNCWTIAEHAGDATPDKTQRLLERARWDTMAAMGAVRGFVTAHLASSQAVAVLDESGQEKKGTHTVGVKRQYVGCAGRVSNAINVVYCTYATPSGHALVGARPYLPAEWAGDVNRRRAAGVPDDVDFATKPELGRQILADLHAAGTLPPWVTGDEVYGRDPHLRSWCENHDTGYVLGVPKSMRITLPAGTTVRADATLTMLEPSSWTIASCGAGSKGERRYTWAWIATTSPRRHLLARRNLTPNAKGEYEVAFFLCFTPHGHPATLHTLITIAGMRWPVEEDFQIGKDAFGLDHSQVRTYPALLRHLVLTMAALAVAAITAAHARTRTNTLPAGPTSPDDLPPADPGLIPLTVAEIKRLFNLLTRTWQPTRHHLHWTQWRQRHQARARWFHQRTRLRHQTQTA